MEKVPMLTAINCAQHLVGNPEIPIFPGDLISLSLVRSFSTSSRESAGMESWSLDNSSTYLGNSGNPRKIMENHGGKSSKALEMFRKSWIEMTEIPTKNEI